MCPLTVRTAPVVEPSSPARERRSPTERYFTIVKPSDLGAERIPAELVAVIMSV
jgi:hypothetical protein